MPESPPRPPQATLAAWLIMAGSVLVVLTAFVELSHLQSVDTRDSIGDYLSKSPGDRFGIGVDAAIRVIRILTFVAAGCATASVFLGREVLIHRSRSARIALSVLAAPLFFTGRTTGGFLPAVVVSAVVVLWLQPSRDWFDGIKRAAPERAVRATGGPPAGPATGGPPAGPAPAPSWPPPLPSGPQREAPWPPQFEPAVHRRPQAVVTAAIVTWVCSGVMVLVALVGGVLIAVNSDRVLESLRDRQASLNSTDVPDGMLLTAIYFWLAVLALWAIASIVVAVFLWRGAGWARAALRGSAGVAAVGLFVLTLGNPLFAPLFAGCVACVVLLARPDVKDWTR